MLYNEAAAVRPALAAAGEMLLARLTSSKVVLALGGLAALLATAALWSGSLAVGTAPHPEVRAILASAMQHAGRTAPRDSRQCVRLEIPNDTFERWRAHLRVKGDPQLGVADPAEYRWTWLAPKNAKSESALQQAVQQAVGAGSGRRQRAMPAEWIEGGLVPTSGRRASESCTVHIYSDPLVVGNWAFVEDDISCGLHCGAGRTLALRKQGEGWTVIATANTWHVGFDRMLNEPFPDPTSNAYADF